MPNLLLQLSLITLITLVGASLGENTKTIVIEEDALELPFYNQEHDEEKILFPESPDTYLPTVDLASKYGYPVETHKLTTEDGYILTLHRIRNGRYSSPAPPEGRPVVLLQHGLLGSSAEWLLDSWNKSLGYRFADQGYDVWMANSRGNVYSREHAFLNTTSKEYWSFSWHEMGKYDLPATINYMLKVTAKKDLYFVGYSMGTTVFYVCMSVRPEYNSKIRLMSALGPMGFVDNLGGPIRLLAPFSTELEFISRLFRTYELLPTSTILNFFGKMLCNQNSPIQFICSNMMFLISGYDVQHLNMSLLPIIAGHYPAGSSVRTPIHYAQGANTGRFCEFDFGTKENLNIYGSPQPPEYDLSKITAPIALYLGSKDWLAVETDVIRFAEKVPNIVRTFRVPFHHLDFLFAIDSPSRLYERVEELMRTF